MSGLTPTLVVVVTNQRDWQHVVADGWYRIPVLRAPAVIAAEYVAFYFTRNFGADAWHVAYYAPVECYHLVRRRELLPDEAHHPRAEHWYYRITLGSVIRLPQPVRSRRLRRVTFIPTTLEQLYRATDVAHLWHTDEEAAVAWAHFRDAAAKATRRLSLEQRSAG